MEIVLFVMKSGVFVERNDVIFGLINSDSNGTAIQHFKINCYDTPLHCISSNKTFISYTFRHNLIAHVIMKKTPQNHSMDIDSPCWLGEIGSI